MRQIVFVNQKDSFHTAPHAHASEFVSHALKSCLHGTITFIQCVLCSERVVRERIRLYRSFQRFRWRTQTVVMHREWGFQ